MRLRTYSAFALAATLAACAQPAPVNVAAAAPPPPPAAAPMPPPPPPLPRPHGPMPKFVPPSHDPAAVPSGTYKIEPNHTQVMFSVLHFGITPFYGTFSQAAGSLTVDAKNPAADQLDVGVPVDSVYTTSPRLTEELKSKPWLDAADYPTMTFKSTKVVPTSKTTARVYGDLTLHGVTKPVTFYASFVAAGVNPMMHLLNVGFTVTGTIKRSDFGVSAAVPLVSDETKIIISAAFVQ
jgi:polyisoprenoid-binding protein YceI